MEQMTNTLLTARMFLLCTAVPYGNGFKKGKGKNKGLLFQQAFLRGIGSFMEWSFYGME